MANIDPATRTHANNADILWNLYDIIDDYLNFDFLGTTLKQNMYDEVSAYLSHLNQIPIDTQVSPVSVVNSKG